ncbi:hypothetical protein M9H77_06859 [Catharanthus roseus]|uniref:Uncharacterized protein n=1 Tax=Catharanthus roseus TaxID=4058 RepID=A0ACC0BTH2_CATRO|nr:hypothetical protein M9H77_06859 [Catharanthus roseus]
MPMLEGKKTMKKEEIAEVEGLEKEKKGSSLSKKLLTLKNEQGRGERLLQVTQWIYLTWKRIFEGFFTKGEVLKRHDDRNVNKLDAYGRLLHHMISNIIIPNVGHKSFITNMHSVVMLALHEHRRMNFGYMAVEHMLATQTSSTKCLPYGCFLTKFFQYFG